MKIGDRYFYDKSNYRVIVEIVEIIEKHGDNRLSAKAKCLQKIDENAPWYLGEVSETTINGSIYTDSSVCWHLLEGQEKPAKEQA